MLIVLATAAVVCGSPSADTLAAGAQTRVYASRGVAYGCSRGHRPLRFGSVSAARVNGRFAAVVRDGRVVVYDLRARRVKQRGGDGGVVHAVRVLGDGTVAWIAGDGESRGAYVNGSPTVRGAGIDPAFLGLGGGVVMTRSGAGYDVRRLSEDDDTGAGRTLARIGSLHLEASRGVVFVRYKRRRMRIDEAYVNESSSVGGGLDRILLAGTTLAGRSGRYSIGSPSGGEVRVLDVTKARRRTLCRSEFAVGDVVLTRDGHIACVADDRIESDGIVMERFEGSVTSLAIRGGRLVWTRDGTEFSGPLPGTTICGPPDDRTLAQNAEIRVYVRGKHAEACDDVSGRILLLGTPDEVQLSGRFAAVREGGALTVYDLHAGAAAGITVRASRMTAIALGETGIAAFVSPDGAGDTVTGLYPGTTGANLYYVRVLDSLVAWSAGEKIRLWRAADTPVRDGRLYTSPGWGLAVRSGQLVRSGTAIGPIPAGRGVTEIDPG
jgi:hypothetical protein